MRILITSGGTKVPIDPVRNITNMSTGKLGSDIAKNALSQNNEVIYLTSNEGKSPFSESFDTYLSANENDDIEKLRKLHAFQRAYRDKYIEYRYQNYTEYASFLETIVKNQKPDVVILAAAVSDYLIGDYSSEKIRSHNALDIHLKLAPKQIHFIKQWHPTTFLVGFKLLINASDSELVNAASNSIHKNNADLIVANNLDTIKRGAHEILIVERNGAYQKITEHLAESIISRVMRR